MSEQTTIERFKSELLAILQETFERVSGIYLDGGTSLFETLDGLSADDASLRTAGDGATIAAQVEHVRFYLDVLYDVMQKQEPVRADWGEIWQRAAEVTVHEWEVEKIRLRESYERIVATIVTYDRWDGDYGIAGALAVLTHSAYHLGALRQSVRYVRSLSHARPV